MAFLCNMTQEMSEQRQVLLSYVVNGRDSWQEFLDIIKTISLHKDNVSLMSKDGQLSVWQMDQSHVSLIEIDADISIDGVVEYGKDGETLSLDVKALWKALNPIKKRKDMQVMIQIDRKDEESRAYLRVSVFDGKEAVDKFEVNLEVVNVTAPVKISKFASNKFTLSAEDYSDMVKQLIAAKSGYVDFESTGEKLLCKGVTDYIDDPTQSRQTTYRISHNEEVAFDNCVYSMDYISVLKYIDRISHSVKAELGETKPVKWTFATRLLNWKISYWIAPRLGD